MTAYTILRWIDSTFFKHRCPWMCRRVTEAYWNGRLREANRA